MGSADAVLQRFGVEPARVERAADMLRPSAPAVAEQLAALLAAVADPALAVIGLERLTEDRANHVALAGLDRTELAELFTLLGASPSLTTVLQTAGPEAIELFLSFP